MKRPRRASYVAAAALGLLGAALLFSMSDAWADIPPRPEPSTPGDLIRDGLGDLRHRTQEAADPRPKVDEALDDTRKKARDLVQIALDGGLADASVTDAAPLDAGPDADAADGEDVAAIDERIRRTRFRERACSELLDLIGEAPIDDRLLAIERRHAERVARIDRVGEIAVELDDNDAMIRVTKLLAAAFHLHTQEVEAWLHAR